MRAPFPWTRSQLSTALLPSWQAGQHQAKALSLALSYEPLDQIAKAGSQSPPSPMSFLSLELLWLMGDFLVFFEGTSLAFLWYHLLTLQAVGLILGCWVYQLEKLDLTRLLGLVGCLSQMITSSSSGLLSWCTLSSSVLEQSLWPTNRVSISSYPAVLLLLFLFLSGGAVEN